MTHHSYVTTWNNSSNNIRYVDYEFVFIPFALANDPTTFMCMVKTFSTSVYIKLSLCSLMTYSYTPNMKRSMRNN